MGARIGRSLEVVVSTRRKEIWIEEKNRIAKEAIVLDRGLIERPKELVPHFRIKRFDLKRISRILVRRVSRRRPLHVLVHHAVDNLMNDETAVEIAQWKACVGSVLDQRRNI